MIHQDKEIKYATHLFRCGELNEALNIVKKILKSNPQNVYAREIEAYILGNQGDLVKSINILEEITASEVYLPKAIYELAGIYINRGDYVKAEFYLRKLLDRGENFFELNFQLGFTLLQQNNYLQSTEYFIKAKHLQPEFIPTYINLGNIYDLVGKTGYAEREYKAAILIDDKNIELLNQYTQFLLKQNLISDARKYNEKILEINPNHIDGLVNKILILEKYLKYSEAENLCDKLLCFDPKNEIAINTKLFLLDKQKKFTEAINFYNSIQEKKYKDVLITKFLEIKAKICDWQGFDELKNTVLHQLKIGKSIYPFTLLYLFDSPELEIKNTNQYIGQTLKRIPGYSFQQGSTKNSRIRVGYISADYGYHPVSFLIAEIFELHNRDLFEIICISIGPNTKDPMRKRIEDSADQFYDFENYSISQLCVAISNLNLDIAIDLNGFTKDSKPEIFLNRVAPIQINFLGYPGTTTVKLSDYLIADKHLISDKNIYQEKIIYLSNSYQPNDSKRYKPDKRSIELKPNVNGDQFIYCCFNNNFKINPEVLEAWSQILHETKGSALWLLEDSKIAKENLLNEFKNRKIDISRIIFAARVNHEDHLARLQWADLFLDTWPYNAHTTASDSLWVGVPVITKMGNTFASRVCGSLLSAAGLQDLITYSIKDYIELAIRFQMDYSFREVIEQKMRNINDSSLFNSNSYTKNLEEKYIQLVKGHSI